MGGKWEVLKWVDVGVRGNEDYRDVSVYLGSSLWQAAKAMIAAKCDGAGCVTLRWR